MPKGNHKTIKSGDEFGQQQVCACGRQFFYRSGDSASATRLTKKLFKLHTARCPRAQGSIPITIPHITSTTTAQTPNLFPPTINPADYTSYTTQ
jgi:hypothetical protein